MEPILNIGIKAARAAGNTIIRSLDRLDRIEVTVKGRNDYASEVDRLAEEDIVQVIHKHYPGHGILAEESGTIPPTRRTPGREAQFEWIIDPIDGTSNFLHGHPDFVVSIGVRRKETMEHAVIFDPLRNEMYTASRNRGAQLNGKRIQVSQQDKIRNSTLSIGFPSRDRPGFNSWMNGYQHVAKKSGEIRTSGSSALDLAHVACGRTDAFWATTLQAWDIAAGSLLVREARGLVADIDGGQGFLESGNIVAAGPGIFNDMLGLVRSGLGKSA